MPRRTPEHGKNFAFVKGYIPQEALQNIVPTAAAISGALITLAGLAATNYVVRLIDTSTYLLPLATALVTLLAYPFAARLVKIGWSTIAVVSATVTGTAVLVLITLAVIWWVETAPGALTHEEVKDWKEVYYTHFTTNLQCAQNTENAYGLGETCTKGGVLQDKIYSNKSGDYTGLNPLPETNKSGQLAIPQFPIVRGRWYAETKVRLASSTPDAACMLMFGYRDENHWFNFRVQDQEPGMEGGKVKVSEYEGALPNGDFGKSTVWLGPIANRSVGKGLWTTLAIKADGNSYEFLVNNRFADTQHPQVQIKDVHGGINIGTVATESDHKTPAICEFEYLTVLQGP